MSNPETKPDLIQPRPEEPELEDLNGEWSEEDIEDENKKPNLGELDDDPDER